MHHCRSSPQMRVSSSSSHRLLSIFFVTDTPASPSPLLSPTPSVLCAADPVLSPAAPLSLRPCQACLCRHARLPHTS
ncbi:hypothetical protein B0H12DRAFT_1097069 [Mycena haematopus]|nr:hypothetical protein B0H12DRAFT_1097069 [Mycena haematopus]